MSLFSRVENIASYLRQSIGTTYGVLSTPLNRSRHQMKTDEAMAYSLIYAIGNRFQNAFVEASLDIRRTDGRNLTRDEERIKSIALGLIRNPNEFMSGRDLAMGFALDSRFLGTGYILTPRENGDPQGRITSLWWAPYEQVTPIFREDASVHYLISGEMWRPEFVLQINNTPNRRNTLVGDGPIPHLLSEIYTDSKSIGRIAAWMGNNAIPSGFLVPPTEGKVLSERDMKSIRAQWQHDAGNDNQGAVIFARNGIKFEQIEFNPRQLDMSSLTAISETRIAAAFAIPPSELGLMSGTQSESYAAEKVRTAKFARSMMVPAWIAIAEQLTQKLMPEYSTSGRLEYFFDTTNVTALQEAKDLLHQRVRNDYTANLITKNEARLETGRDTVPSGDMFSDLSSPNDFRPAQDFLDDDENVDALPANT